MVAFFRLEQGVDDHLLMSSNHAAPLGSPLTRVGHFLDSRVLYLHGVQARQRVTNASMLTCISTFTC